MFERLQKGKTIRCSPHRGILQTIRIRMARLRATNEPVQENTNAILSSKKRNGFQDSNSGFQFAHSGSHVLRFLNNRLFHNSTNLVHPETHSTANMNCLMGRPPRGTLYQLHKKPGMAEGERTIEGTRRQDGTYRKPIRVRAGFKSEELDVEARAYVSRGARQRMAMEKAGIPGMPQSTKPKTEKEKAQIKKEARKRRKAKQKEAKANSSAEGDEEEEAGDDADELPVKGMQSLSVGPQGQSCNGGDNSAAEEDPSKRKKKLEKLLKQIMKLEESGKELDPDQQKKVAKKAEIEAELASL
eukprot:g46684.t1